MSMMPNPYSSAPLDYQGQRSDSAAVARFFNSVYAWMSAGLALTALVAWYFSTRPELLMGMGRGGLIMLFVAELVLVGVISAAVQRINAAVATLLFLLYAAINGVMLSGIFLVYTNAAIGSAFAITAGMFGAMSLYGFLTGKDLSGMGSFLYMALIGLIIATVVSLFWHNTILGVLINYVGVFIFTGLTAYDTQKLKAWALETSGNAALAARLSINGALTLYLDFINLFLMILRIMGDRNR